MTYYSLELDRQYPQYGFAQHKGYGTKARCAAILQYGSSPVHRKAFLRKLLQSHDTQVKPDGVGKLPSASICFSVATRFGNVITGYGAEKLISLHKRAKFLPLWKSKAAGRVRASHWSISLRSSNFAL